MKYKTLIQSILITLSLVIAHSSFAGQLGNWNYTNGFNGPGADVAVIARDTMVYDYGGYPYNNTPYPVEHCTIRPDGTLTPWVIESTQMVEARGFATGFATDSYVYAIGGENANSLLTTMERAPINADGTLGIWTTIEIMTTLLGDEAALIQYNQFVYMIGGYQGTPSNFSASPNIYRTTVSPDGSLGTWTLLSSQLAIGSDGLSTILINSTLYVVGGNAASGAFLRNVEMAILYPDGELGVFSTISYTGAYHSFAGLFYDGQYLNVIGGWQEGNYFEREERATINPDGSLGVWGPAPYLIDEGGGSYLQTTTDAYMINGGNDVEYAPIIPTTPTFSTFPSLKLFTGQSIFHAFNIEDYNSGDISTSYSILSNFLGLTSLDSSSVNQASYGSPTTGTNIYLADNAYGEGTATNEVKYSTYKIYKLPKVGLTVGSSWDVNIANYTYFSTGLAIPPSFGNPDAISVSDTTLVSATWLGNTAIQLTSLQAFPGAVEIDVTASPNALSPYNGDVDVEDIQVYTNLLSNSTFSTSNDTSIWMPFELAPGRTTLATQSWMSSYTDSAGTQANGVWQFTFADANGGVKSTPAVSDWINITNGQWYTFRIRLVADSTNNSHQSFLYGYTNYPSAGTQTDIAANILFGVPTVWTWQEVPLLTHGSSTTGYPQFQLKAGGAGSIYVDEIQIINATPALLEARSNTKFHYLYGQFTSANDTTGWGQQISVGAATTPAISVDTVNSGLTLTFDGSTVEGIKWTANNGIDLPDTAFTFPTPNQHHDVNLGLTVSLPVGSFNSVGVVLLAVLGVQTQGQQAIGIPNSNLIAVADVGTLAPGNYYAEGNAVNPYYQAQFIIRSDLAGVVSLTDVDFATDNDDPNFGDASLFP